MNKIQLVGRITKDVELQTTMNGVDYVRFNVACKSKMKNEDNHSEEREVDQNEVRYKEIKAQFLTLVPIKDEEKPYYVVRNYTKYSLDYNNDPPTECNLSTSTAYELHIPKEYIEQIQKHTEIIVKKA